MAELKCPHCGQAFSVDDTELASIVAQIRDSEFDKDIHKKLTELTQSIEDKHALEIENMEDKHAHELEINETRLRLEAKQEQEKEKEQYEKQIEKLKADLQKEKDSSQELKLKIDKNESEKKLAIMEAVKKAEDEKRDLEKDIQGQKEKYELELRQKDETIDFYKDMKTKMSTKMVGESLEQHCEIEFNKIRMSAFPNAYFEKDNDARSGSKGDYIYRETDEDGTELLSIMFEMKNEMDTTSTKHKNEDFFKELDKDRNEKGCEYAVLVSLLESDNDFYNSGIVDVSYRYEKMYVVRPQCFISIISLLRNAAKSAMDYKKELAVVRNQNIDVTNFETRLNEFKEGFARNYELAQGHFDKAIDAIDKSIKDLQNVREFLTKSERQLGIATKKVEDVTIKKLTRGNPTMQEAFENARKSEN